MNIIGKIISLGLMCSGEHIDYSSYPVLPMAIELDIVVLLRRNNDRTLRLVNTARDMFPDKVFLNIDANVSIDSKASLVLLTHLLTIQQYEWTNYFLAGCKGVLEFLRIPSEDTVGFDAIVSVLKLDSCSMVNREPCHELPVCHPPQLWCALLP